MNEKPPKMFRGFFVGVGVVACPKNVLVMAMPAKRDGGM